MSMHVMIRQGHAALRRMPYPLLETGMPAAYGDGLSGQLFYRYLVQKDEYLLRSPKLYVMTLRS